MTKKSKIAVTLIVGVLALQITGLELVQARGKAVSKAVKDAKSPKEKGAAAKPTTGTKAIDGAGIAVTPKAAPVTSGSANALQATIPQKSLVGATLGGESLSEAAFLQHREDFSTAIASRVELASGDREALLEMYDKGITDRVNLESCIASLSPLALENFVKIGQRASDVIPNLSSFQTLNSSAKEDVVRAFMTGVHEILYTSIAETPVISHKIVKSCAFSKDLAPVIDRVPL